MIERYSRPEMSAIWSLENRTDLWLSVEILACEAWARLGAIPPEALAAIRNAHYDLRRMAEIEAESQHDIIAFLRSIQEQMGPEGRFLHLGLTSTDVVDTGQAVQIKESGKLLLREVDGLLETLRTAASRYKQTVIIGRTHGIHAEPLTFGLKLALWYDEMRRNRERLVLALQQATVGKLSGAVGTHANLPPQIEEYVCSHLGIAYAPISSQIVQRDRHAFLISVLAVLASSLDKFATEIRHLQRTEVSEVAEPFGEGQQGSSAMPHKRNPVICERICGLARIMRGYVVPALEDVPLWHERDISHSSVERVVLPDSFILLDYILDLTTGVISGMEVNEERMITNLYQTRGLIFSQRVLLELIERGMGRQEAYRFIQSHAKRVWKGEGDFVSLLKGDPAITTYLSPTELDRLCDYHYHLRYINESFQRVGLEEKPL